MRIPLLAALAALTPFVAAAATLDVPLDQAIRLTLRTPAHDVIIGNPNIADVEVSDQRHLILTGKTGGVTNLIVTDERGRTVFNRQIVVTASSGSQVAFIDGGLISTYVCTPGCTLAAGQVQPPGVGSPSSMSSASAGSVSAPVAPGASAGVTPQPAQP